MLASLWKETQATFFVGRMFGKVCQVQIVMLLFYFSNKAQLEASINLTNFGFQGFLNVYLLIYKAFKSINLQLNCHLFVDTSLYFNLFGPKCF